MKTARLVCYLASLSVTIVVAPAYANGRSSPRSADMSLVKAVCEERSDERRLEIFRARLVGGDGPGETLNVRFGNAGEQLGIVTIRSLTLPRDRRQSDGFVSGTVIRENDKKEAPVMVQVGTAKSPVRLTGFTATGTSVGVDLAKCKKVDFSPLKASDAESKPTPRPKP